MHKEQINIGWIRTTALGLGGLIAATSGDAAQATRRPNIVWIMPDDMGYGDLGCYGCKDFPTPNIDRIAAEGVRLTSFYAAAPVCTPSRGCSLTGQYPDKLGLGGALMGKGGMPSEVVTIAEVLKDAGYATGLVGKWHLGYGGDKLPNNQGFDTFYGHRGGKIDYFAHSDTAQKVEGSNLGKHDFYENETEIFPEGYATELFTRRAVTFIEEHKERPFFLFLAYNAPHYARPGVLQAPVEYIRKFAGDQPPTKRQLYAAMMSCMDDGIGTVLETLKANGLEEHTIVMFISDNGADPSNGGSNQPLVGAKWKYDEGGIRVPMIAKWPGKLPSGKTCGESVHMIDLFPTTLGAAAVAMPAGVPLDGLDVMDILAGNVSPERPLFFKDTVVRKGKWKLIDGRLYDLESDLQERNNLAEQQPEMVQHLQQIIAERQAALAAKR